MSELTLGRAVWFTPGDYTGADFLSAKDIDLECGKIYVGFIAGTTDRVDEVNLMVLDYRGRTHSIESVKVVEQSDCVRDSRTCFLRNEDEPYVVHGAD